MKTSLFSQSLFAVPLEEAIEMTGKIGFEAIELACFGPHLSLELAQTEAPRLLRRIKNSNLRVAALSLSSHFTSIETLDKQLESAIGFIECAPAFETDIVKITPGSPGSAQATDEHWGSMQKAVRRLVEAARRAGVRLALETHLRGLSDRVSSTRRILDLDDTKVLGVNLDFCNVAFGGDDPLTAIEEMKDRLYLTHVKNGYLWDGEYDFRPLDDGMVSYPPIIERLYEVGFKGYLSVECLGASAREKPYETVKHDYEVLRGLLRDYAAPRSTG